MGILFLTCDWPPPHYGVIWPFLSSHAERQISLSPPHLIRPLILSNQGPTLCHCYSVAESYLTLCIPIDWNIPGFLDLHHLPEFAQIHVHWVKVKSEGEVVQLCPTLCDPMDYSLSGFMGFSRQEYWSGLPFPSPGDLPNLGIEPRSPAL